MSAARPFEIGVFTFGEITADPVTGRPLDPATRLREIIDKILWEHEMLGHDRFLAQIGLGGLPFADTARSIELLATEVLPTVRREISVAAKAVA